MKIFIEGHKYKTQEAKSCLPDISKDGSLEHVGYYYDSNIDDYVFILPSVLLNKNDEVFAVAELSPESLIDPDGQNRLNDKQKDFINFIKKFSVWIYRAIAVYKDKNPDSKIVFQSNIVPAGKGKRRPINTSLDIILALIQFHEQNQDFFIFTLRNIHSGYNKVNWPRTVRTSEAIVQDETPIYLDLVNKKKKINFEEELLVIYFSILNYIRIKYAFRINIDFNFKLITGKLFEDYIIKGLGTRKLLQLKYKYFSDKALELWDLCYTFFDDMKQIRLNGNKKEYLLVKDFYIVFQSIIDELIGDKDIPKGLIKQKDGKIVDHMYVYQDLSQNNEKKIYYIGDSKYYKKGTNLGSESVYKQFTYARNVIQWNLNLFMKDVYSKDNKDEAAEWESDKNTYKTIRLRDDLTEGYAVIPNFFISARMDYNNPNYKDDKITYVDNNRKEFYNRHWDNRLFDRDTLLICHYDVDFFYVLSLYAHNSAQEKNAWKKYVRSQFREKLREALKNKYDFYELEAVKKDAADYIEQNFKKLIGKIYCPDSYKSEDAKIQLFLALDNSKDFAVENQILIDEIEKSPQLTITHRPPQKQGNLETKQQGEDNSTPESNYKPYPINDFPALKAAEEQVKYNN